MTSIETNSYIHISNGISNKIRTKELKKFMKRYDEGKLESLKCSRVRIIYCIFQMLIFMRVQVI